MENRVELEQLEDLEVFRKDTSAFIAPLVKVLMIIENQKEEYEKLLKENLTTELKLTGLNKYIKFFTQLVNEFEKFNPSDEAKVRQIFNFTHKILQINKERYRPQQNRFHFPSFEYLQMLGVFRRGDAGIEGELDDMLYLLEEKYLYLHKRTNELLDMLREERMQLDANRSEDNSMMIDEAPYWPFFDAVYLSAASSNDAQIMQDAPAEKKDKEKEKDDTYRVRR